MTDYYELLEVTSTASVEVIRAAYKAGVKKYHPDNFTSEKDKARATEQLKLLNEALETLTDESRRARYDEELTDGKSFLGRDMNHGNTQNAKETQRQAKAESGSGHDTRQDLVTHVEALIIHCKNETDYLDLHNVILKGNAPETDKIQMLRILDEFTKVRLLQELDDESNLTFYRDEVKSMRSSIIIYLVIGFLLTAKFSWAFFVAVVLCISGYCGAKEDRENLARAERSAHLVAIYRTRGFKI